MKRSRSQRRGPSRAAPPRSRQARLAIGAMVAALALLAGIIVYLRARPWTWSEPSHPNVLLITIDTLRWDHVGCYGDARAQTPAIDSLAARGVRFETAIMHVPLTAPSHATILTGVLPFRHGVRDNGAFVVPPDLPSLATSFRQAGYRTAAFVSGFPLDRRFGFATGFDTFDDHLPRSVQARTSETERRADATTDRALAWLNAGRSSDRAGQQHERPWFAWVHYFDPHAPYDPPAGFRARFASNPYDGEIAFVDEQIARLVERLSASGQMADTIVMLTADHGESLGEHGEETHGVFVYDSTLRVPLILAGPHVPSSRVSRTVARGIDLMPTLLELAGVPTPAGVQGRSLRAGLRNDDALADAPAYIESLLCQRHLGWAPLHGLRDARWKYIDAPQPELYDVHADPHEVDNRARGEPQRAGAISHALADELAGAAAKASTPATPDRASMERLAALGYLGRGPSASHKATGRDPKSGIALINRLEHAIAGVRTDPRTAAAELRGVLSDDPGVEIARAQLAVALSASGDHAGAIEQIRTLQAQGSATAEDLLLLSESLRASGRTDEAARALDEAARLDPRSPEPAITAARAAMAAGNADAATAAFRRALDLSPDNLEALAGLGEVALARGDLNHASAAFEHLLANDPSDVRARSRLGMIRGRQGRMDDAIALLQQVANEAPGDAEALAGLAAALARTGRPADAVPYFQRAIDAGLRTPAVLNGLGFSKLESGDHAGALAALRASLAINPQQPGVDSAVRQLAAEGGPR